MSVLWLATLVLYGLIAGWDFSPLWWWLLVPFTGQDFYDVRRK
jgi:hypothetical protein